MSLNKCISSYATLLMCLILSLSSCTVGYKNDGKEVTWHTWNEGSGHNSRKVAADPKSFEALDDDYGRDAVHAFYEGDIIEGADGSSFKTLGNWYASDDKHVYISGNLINGADAASFKVHRYRLGEDKNDFYNDTTALNVRDKATFEILKYSSGKESSYAKDKYNGYYMNGTVIPGIDYHTFHPVDVESWQDRCYAADKNKVYYYGEVVPMADPATFKVIDFAIGQDKNRTYKGKVPTQIKDYTKLEKVGPVMYNDGTNIYDLNFKILPDVDVATFEHIEDNWYKDKNKVWWMSKPLPGANPQTFMPVEVSSYRSISGKKDPFSGGDFNFGKDDKHVFYQDSIIVGADPMSFEKIDFHDGDSWTVFDKNKVYQGKDSPNRRKYLKKKYGKR